MKNMAVKKRGIFAFSILLLCCIIYKYRSIETLNKVYENILSNTSPVAKGDAGEGLEEFEEKYNLSSLEKRLDEALLVANRKATILVWSQPSHKASPSDELNQSECGACHVTYNKSLVSDPTTKAVVFYVKDMQQNKWPSPRRLDQYYVWWSEESPSSIKLEGHSLVGYDKLMNLTMSYRKDSDVFSPFGTPAQVLQRLGRKPHKKTTAEVENLMKKKRKLALWVVSNCDYTEGANARMDLVIQLRDAGLDIDLGGSCFKNGVKNWNFEDYKFYFSLENSVHCRDYVTEKFYHNALESGCVPVVFGPDKIDYDPPAALKHSFIYAKDFSINGLIDYLRYLDGNDTAYKEYFEWRKTKVQDLPQRRRATGFCHLCRLLYGINFDSIFNPNYNSSTSLYSLFTENQTKRTSGSVIEWWYGRENVGCLNYHHSIRILSNSYFTKVLLIVLLLLLLILCLVVFSVCVYKCHHKKQQSAYHQF